jgi:hypothetical protein
VTADFFVLLCDSLRDAEIHPKKAAAEVVWKTTYAVVFLLALSDASGLADQQALVPSVQKDERQVYHFPFENAEPARQHASDDLIWEKKHSVQASPPYCLLEVVGGDSLQA